MNRYKIIDTFFNYKSKWVEFIGEVCFDGRNKLDYYRIKRSDSIIILPIIDDKLLFPQLYYRHGVQEYTLDFPGGRIDSTDNINSSVLKILKNELGVFEKDVSSIQLVSSEKGYYVDSSFSTQKLYTVTVTLNSNEKKYKKKSLLKINKDNIWELYSKMDCLQCRFALIDWYLKYRKGS